MNFSEEDKKYMRRCLDLARMGKEGAAPNPMVGCVIVHEGQIIGEGYHLKCGGPHAEVNAIDSVKDTSLLKESTLYVNLEPCSHHGMTPPCSDLIINHQIPRVKIGQVDINPLVSGRGILKLEKAGVEVEVGLLEGACIDLNKRFIVFHEAKRPYVMLKWAQTRDGYIDITRDNEVPDRPTWINDEIDLALVHKWRAEEKSIMVGTNTAYNDNSKLTARLWAGNDPLRITIDRQGRLPEELNLFNGKVPTLVFTAEERASSQNLEFIKIDFKEAVLQQLLTELYQRKIQSLIVEGGAQLLNSFIREGLWDEARVIIGNRMFYEGVKAPAVKGNLKSVDALNTSTLYVYQNPGESIPVPY